MLYGSYRHQINKSLVTVTVRMVFSLYSEVGKGAKVMMTSDIFDNPANRNSCSQSCRLTFQEKRRCKKWSCLNSQTGTETFSERNCSPTQTLCVGALRKRKHRGHNEAEKCKSEYSANIKESAMLEEMLIVCCLKEHLLRNDQITAFFIKPGKYCSVSSHAIL